PAGGGDLPAGELVRGGVCPQVRPRPEAPHEPDPEGGLCVAPAGGGHGPGGGGAPEKAGPLPQPGGGDPPPAGSAAPSPGGEGAEKGGGLDGHGLPRRGAPPGLREDGVQEAEDGLG